MNRRQFFKRIGQVGAVAAVSAVAAKPLAAQPGKYGYAASVPLSSLNGGSIWEDAQADGRQGNMMMAILRWASGILAYVRMRALFTKAERAAIKMVADDISALPVQLYFRKPLETQKPPV